MDLSSTSLVLSVWLLYTSTTGDSCKDRGPSVCAQSLHANTDIGLGTASGYLFWYGMYHTEPSTNTRAADNVVLTHERLSHPGCSSPRQILRQARGRACVCHGSGAIIKRRRKGALDGVQQEWTVVRGSGKRRVCLSEQFLQSTNNRIASPTSICLHFIHRHDEVHEINFQAHKPTSINHPYPIPPSACSSPPAPSFSSFPSSSASPPQSAAA